MGSLRKTDSYQEWETNEILPNDDPLHIYIYMELFDIWVCIYVHILRNPPQ